MKLIYHDVGDGSRLADSEAVLSDNELDEIDKLIASGLVFMTQAM